MNKDSDFLESVISGAIAGLVIIGLFGRLAMAVVSLSMGLDVNFSLGGLFQTLFIAVIIGVIGGIINYTISRLWNFNRFTHSIILSIVLFLLSLTVAVLFTQMKLTLSAIQLLTLTVVFVFYFIFGFTVNLLIKYMTSTVT